MNSSNKSKNKKKEFFSENIKSKFILKIIFVHLQRNKILQIIKYNKKIQKRLNINEKDYKEYNDIEIEIIPKTNEYGVFIHIFDKNEKPYYHIYFNDNKKEINRTKFNKHDKIQKIIIIINAKVKSFYKLFENCKCIKSIYFKKFYSDNIINMSFMFSGCSSLKELNLSSFNTDNVTNMSFMFFGCSSLKKLNLSHFNTNNVTNMNSMFSNCSSLKKLNLSNFNTTNVLNMEDIFSNCSLLKDLSLFNIDTNKVTNLIKEFHKKK